MIEINPSKLEDIKSIIPRLREEDKREIETKGNDPRHSLLEGYLLSEPCYSVYNDGLVVAMFGVVPYGSYGVVWMIGSKELNKLKIALFRQGKEWFDKVTTPYEYVCNIVDSRNILHIKWLEFVGVRFTNTILINNVEFIQFVKGKI